MRRAGQWIWMMLVLILAVAPSVVSAQQGGGGEGILVGRVSRVEGRLLRYVPEEKDWVASTGDAPFGMNDALYSDQDGKAEFLLPNDTWIRIGGNTQLQLIALREDVTEVDVASGVVRLCNKGKDAVLKATTPFGYVLVDAGVTVDLYVGDESVEVAAVKGKADFIHEGDQTRYEAISGSSSVVADSRDVTSGAGTLDVAWDEWNRSRDGFWAKRLEVKGESAAYLPRRLQEEAATFEENGRWERVYYEGEYRTYWRPTRVAAGWAPFTVGHWTDWYGDSCWIPEESFGYVTHHYGNWVYVDNLWYWAPPVVGVSVGVGPVIDFGWYPGRVGWIHSGDYIGWVPLAPFEPYYCHYGWGPRAVVVGGVGAVNVSVGGFAYIGHSVIIEQSRFFGVANYASVRISNIDRTTVINDFHAVPVINDTVITNYHGDIRRFHMTGAAVERRPHNEVNRRIEQNHGMLEREGSVGAAALRQQAAEARAGRFDRSANVGAPRVGNRMVAPGDEDKPRSEMQSRRGAIKSGERSVVQPPFSGREKTVGGSDASGIDRRRTVKSLHATGRNDVRVNSRRTGRRSTQGSVGHSSRVGKSRRSSPGVRGSRGREPQDRAQTMRQRRELGSFRPMRQPPQMLMRRESRSSQRGGAPRNAISAVAGAEGPAGNNACVGSRH